MIGGIFGREIVFCVDFTLKAHKILEKNCRMHFFALIFGLKSDNITDADSAIYDFEVSL